MWVKCAVLAAVLGTALGCSWIAVESKYKSKHLVARTLELSGLPVKGKKEELPNNWVVKKIPAGTHCNPAAHSGKRCKSCNVTLTPWEVKYSHVGVGERTTTDGTDSLFDGLNSEGLTVDVQTLRQSDYMHPVSVPKDAPRICFTSLAAYILGNFATTQEVRQFFGDAARPVFVIAPKDNVTLDYYHWAVTDKKSDMIVIEVIKGVVHLHTNTVRTMTNDPPFDFHLQNLNNYVRMDVEWATSGIAVDTEIGTVPFQTNHGFNTLGLPGDYTPTGRFVRLFNLLHFGEKNIDMKTSADMIELATGVLNSVHIPKGVLAFKAGSDPSYDYTQYCSMKSPQELLFYFRTYSDMQWRVIDLRRLDWSSVSLHDMYGFDTGVRDITGEIKDGF